jgi:phosphoglycerate dehydrogenase-like enzyme
MTDRLRVLCLTGPPGGVDPQSFQLIADSLPDVDVIAAPVAGGLDSHVVADGVVASVMCPLLAELPEGIPWIHIFGTGVEGLPAQVFQDRVVTCSRGASAVPIAEFVLASMLAFEKRLPETWVTEAPRHWYRAELGGLRGRNLAVFGLGGIGSEVARLGRAFGMSVIGMRRKDSPSTVPELRMADNLRQLVAGAHHVVVAAPATPATFHVFDDEVFGSMRRGAHLVNVARGSLIDHQALRRAMDTGIVARASLDTTDPEPLPPGHWLFTHPGARISPHVSWSNPDGQQRIIELCVENIRSRAAGMPLAGIVDGTEGY